MNAPLSATVLVTLLLSVAGCRKPPTAPTANSPVAPPAASIQNQAEQPPANGPRSAEDPPFLEIEYTKAGSLSYLGYTLTRKLKTVKIEGKDTEISYAVLTKGGRQFASFDGLHDHPLGNETEFGLAPLLGGNSQQILVEQSQWRQWRQWVVDLSPQPRIIFDGGEFGLFGGTQAIDIDRDGVYELATRVTAYYGFADLAMAYSPLVEVYFKYDSRAGKYVPANSIFAAFALKDVEKEIAQVKDRDQFKYRSEVLSILLRYIYAGKETEGWAFFEREYQQPDRHELKGLVLKKLTTEPVYQYIRLHQRP